MRLAIESGRSLAESFPRTLGLPAAALGLIRHGESSGRLAESLQTARIMLEHGEELKKKLGSAMAYPSVIGLFAAALTLSLVRGVMPQIIPMLVSLHVELPLLTRVVIACSQGLVSYGAYGLLASVFIAVGLVALFRKSIAVKFFIQTLFMKIPIVGRLYTDYCVSILLQTCGSLIETGSAAGTSYAKSVASLPLLPLRREFESKMSDLNRGGQMHVAFKGNAVRSFVPSLLSAGEMSGTLGASMIRAATVLDRDIDHSLKRLTSLVEPLMMVGMGLIVGSIALSIMMPIYDISKVLQK